MADRSGFTEYVAARRPLMHRTAWVLTGDHHHAEDLVQQVLAKLYVGWPRVQRMDSVDAYVRRMLVNANVDESKVRERVAPPHPLHGDPLQWGLGIVAESNTQVEKLYTMEKNGELEPDHPSQRALDFMHDRMAVGASNLRDLWLSAWQESEKLSRQIGRPE